MATKYVDKRLPALRSLNVFRQLLRSSRSPSASDRCSAVMEPLEPRLLMSADFPLLAGGLDSLDDALKEHFFRDDLFSKPLPGIALSETVDTQSFAPTLLDLFLVDKTKLPTDPTVAGFALHGFVGADNQISLDEWLTKGVFDKASDYLNDAANAAKTNAEFAGFLSSGLDFDYSSSLGLKLDATATFTAASNSFDLTFIFEHTFKTALDLGVNAEQLGISLDFSDVAVKTALDVNLDFKVVSDGATPANKWFEFKFDKIQARTEASADLTGATISFGFLDATVGNAASGQEVMLTAIADASFNGGDWSQTSAIAASAFAITDTGSQFTVNLPVSVNVTGLGFIHSATLDFTLDPFDLATSGQRLAIPLNFDNSFDTILNFTRLDTGKFLGAIDGLMDALDGLRTTDYLTGYAIPFTNSTLGDVLNFGEMLSRTLLYDDMGDTDPSNDKSGLLKRDGDNLVPAFNSVQELLTTLEGKLPSGFSATYSNNALTFNLDFDQALFGFNTAFNFDADLAPIANIRTDANVSVSANAGLSLILGIDLSASIEGVALLDTAALAVGATVTRPTATAVNDVNNAVNDVNNLITDRNSKFSKLINSNLVINGTTINVTGLEDNKSIFDLVNDINQGIKNSGLDGQIKAESMGSRIILTSLNGADFTVAANDSLGFTAQSSNKDDFVVLDQDGVRYGVSLNGAETVTFNELKAKIETATANRISVAMNADKTSIVLTDTAFDSTQTTGEFRIEATNGSAAAFLLGIAKGDKVSANDVADGVVKGSAIAGPTIADRLFLENAIISGDFILSTPTSIHATADFGFVGISLEGNGTIGAKVEIPLKNPNETSPGGRVSLNQLYDNLFGNIAWWPGEFESVV